VGMLQETAALSCSIGISVLGAFIVAVQPYLIGAAVVLGLFGGYGIRAGRARREPEPALARADGC